MGYYDNDLYENGYELKLSDEDVEERALALKLHKKHRYRIDLVKNTATSKGEEDSIEEDVNGADTFDDALSLAWQIFISHIKENEKELIPCLDSDRRYEVKETTSWFGDSRRRYVNVSADTIKEIRIMDDAGNDEFHINVREWINIYVMLKLMGIQTGTEAEIPKKKPVRKKTANTKTDET